MLQQLAVISLLMVMGIPVPSESVSVPAPSVTSSSTAVSVARTVPNTYLKSTPPPALTTAAHSQRIAFGTYPDGLRTQCRFNGGTWEWCTSPFLTTAIQKGTNTFEARAFLSGSPDATPLHVVWTMAPSWNRAHGVDAATAYACALSREQQVLCWFYREQTYWKTTEDSARVATVLDDGVMAGKSFTSVSTGRYGACAITQRGRVICWDKWMAEPVFKEPYLLDLAGVLPAGRAVVEVSVADAHACLLDDRGQAWCWGDNEHGQLGDGTFDDAETPVPVDIAALPPGTHFTSVTAGGSHSCAVTDQGAGYCWGAGSDGQLGNGRGLDLATPQPLTEESALGGRPITVIEAGGYHTCAVDEQGKTYCWGRSALGVPGSSSVPVATFAEGDLVGVTVQSLSAGEDTTCAIGYRRQSGRVYCWGAGHGTNPLTTRAPTEVDWPRGSEEPVDVGAAHGAACATLPSGELRCWGGHFWGRYGPRVPLRVAKPDSHATPDTVIRRDVADSTTWLRLEVRTPGVATYECRLDGAAWAACDHPYFPGDLASGIHHVTVRARIDQLVDPFPAEHSWTQLTRWQDVGWITDNGTECAGDARGRVACSLSWDPELLTTPAKHGLTFDTLDNSSETHFCGLSDGQAFCWGNNKHGWLGVGDLEPRSAPTPVDDSGVLAGKRLIELDSADEFTCVLDDLGRVYCWGYGAAGNLGIGTREDAKSPVAIPRASFGNADVVALSAAGSDFDAHVCALTEQGAAYCWGSGVYGVLGTGASTRRLVPTPVVTTGALQGVGLVAIETGSQHTCAVSTRGRAFCWGERALGDGSELPSNVPVAVVADGVLDGKTLTDVTVTLWTSCAIDTDGKAYCWGSQPGLGGYVMTGDLYTAWPALEPIAVWDNSLLDNVAAVDIEGSCILSDAGEAYCWGDTDQGPARYGSHLATPVSAPIWR